MKEYLDTLTQRNPDRNDGYTWVLRDEVYVPIIRVYLSITKRTYFHLPLLDEVTLRLLAEGMNEIGEISNILGIERSLLEITIADLYKKDLVYCSADKCTLRPLGKIALQKLQVTQRKKDTLRNVYYDPINKRVLEKSDNINFQDKVQNDDKKLKADFNANDISVFREDTSIINKIFEEEMDIYNDKTKAEPDELLSINSIANVYPKFLKFPVYIYVSNSGNDIDVLSINKNNETLFNAFKSVIIEQIRKRDLLKKSFYSYPVKEIFLLPDIEINSKIKELQLASKKSKLDEIELKKVSQNEILKTRKLFNDEFDLLLKYLLNESIRVEIKVSHLDEWYNKELIYTILHGIGGEKIEAVYYNSCKQLNKCINYMEKRSSHIKNNIKNEVHNDYIGIYFDDKYAIKGIPQNVKILNSETYIHRLHYYLECRE